MCVWLLIAAVLLMFPAQVVVKFIDELLSVSFLAVGIGDCLYHRAWKRYRPLLIFLGIFAFYTIYSLTVVHYNVPSAVLLGVLLDAKPYFPLLVILCMAPQLTVSDRKLIKSACVVNIGLLLIGAFGGERMILEMFTHWAIYGGIAMVTAIAWLLASDTDDGRLRNVDRWVVVGIVLLGFMSGRSKYGVEAVMFLFFLYLYKPGMLRTIKPGTFVVMALLGVVAFAVVYDKLTYYFIDALMQSDDPNSLNSYARPALYYGAFVILTEMHPLFGSGLGSFASYASITPYSNLYAEIGIDKVYGLTPSAPDFVSDAYFASLAQFGLVGVGLFVFLWIWIYNRLRPLTRCGIPRAKYMFVVGTMVIIFVMVEMTTGTMVFMPTGLSAMTMLGIVAGNARRVVRSSENERMAAEPPYIERHLRPAVAAKHYIT